MIIKLKLTILAPLVFAAINLYSQDEEKPSFTIAGSVDTYYKYNFSGKSQINTGFNGAQNSFGIRMVDLIMSQTKGKASFVGEVAFGPRAEATAPGPVLNLYISYQFSKLLSITGGFMSTFVGYELISPVSNFNYTSFYLFANGPFQNGGVKANFHLSDRAGLMVGICNRFDSYTNEGHSLSLGSQLFLVPVEGWNLYLNFVSSNFSGTEADLTSTYQATERLKLGLNAYRLLKQHYRLLFKEV